MKLSLSLLAVALILGCQGKTTARSPAAMHYEKGVQLAQKGEMTQAAAEWQLAIAMDPADPRPYFALADRWEQAGQPDQAAGILERLELARPATPHLECRLAQLLFVQGRAARAEERAAKAVAAEPQCAIAHAVHGMALEQAGETGKGIAELEAAHRLDPKNEPIALTLAQVLGRAGRRDEAARLAEAALAANPKSVDAQYLRGWLLAQRPGRERETTEALRRALALDADHPRSHAALGAVLARAGEFDEARRHLERARVALPDEPELLRDLARVYRGLGDRRAAALEREAGEGVRLQEQWKALRRRHRADPENAAINLELARVERRRGDSAEALERVRAVLQADPNNTAALKLMHELLGTR